MWNTNCGKGLTEPQSNAPWQHLNPRQRGLGSLEGTFVFLHRSLQTPIPHLSGEGCLPYMSFVIILRRNFVRKNHGERNTHLLYACHFYFFFFFFLLKHLPCPRPCRRLSPSFKGPSEAFLWIDSSYDTRTGGEPTQEARQLAANTATAAAAASLPARVWTAPSPRHQPWCAI